MSITTIAAVLRSADGPLTLDEVTLDDPGPGEVAVRIAGVGVCHTDFLARTPVAAPPLVPGHEGAGVVEAVGAGVAGLTVGDAVVLSFDSCGHCHNCRGAHPAYCDTFWVRNLSGFRADRPVTARDGGGNPLGANWFGQSSFAEVAVVKAGNAIKVDSDLPVHLLGPLSCSILTGAGSVFNVLAVEPGSSVAIYGAGAVGLAAVMAAKVAGASTIVAVDKRPERLALAEKLGATHVLTAEEGGVARSIRTVARGGVQAVLDTTGNPRVVADAVDALAMRGVCGCVGTQLQPFSLNPGQMVGRTITGILEGDAVPNLLIPRLIRLWRDGNFPFDELVTFFPFDEINEAEAATRRGDVVKPILLPTGDTR
ncbi:NAD(P)-dependent alcohol dehydrogenase [Mycobacteroides immunogenum]|uniref:Alcohol dehydrogenase n=1 Tax=Mycobacteroides immunogenum TaxID=83262 RepID=A0A7V8LJH5_9MYCO|nr:NAD(P)-dependent alcohol dehydrogenase [Mycobacteroides immunogenum]AMT72315.1 alcohol dehydrogenase [Mycobacteroides immunogenum]ANO05458.1 alcohol dehydrogenase [Mycobacteroides immunogenum]KIU41627.1 alcohol dehydrogenase [Mycobacteroides immunogenum]KPG02992.1 alcohol dehydrogenase [Mycobacteroides immunogenum]KPG03068.1 alcohol dehydrogenase [Mycobacteroides immunogenum]